VDEVDRSLEEFRYSDAAQALHRFLWSELCDWGLEAAKPRLYEGDEGDRRDAADVLAWTLERSLRLLHPIMPFVTEEAWQRFGAGASVVVAPWPEAEPAHRDEEAEVRFGFAQEVVTAVRRFRKAHGLRDSMGLAVRVHPSTQTQASTLADLRPEIERLANASALEVLAEPGDPADCARLVADGAQLLIPLAGVLDPEVERSRLTKRLAEIDTDSARIEAKLGNEAFLAKAPSAVVEKERAKLAALKEEAATLAGQLAELG
jgi:valyl-tRNA synthetase